MQPKTGSDFVSLDCCTFFLGCFLPPPLPPSPPSPPPSLALPSCRFCWGQRERKRALELTTGNRGFAAYICALTRQYLQLRMISPYSPIVLFLFLFNCFSSLYSFCPLSVPTPSIKTAVIKFNVFLTFFLDLFYIWHVFLYLLLFFCPVYGVDTSRSLAIYLDNTANTTFYLIYILGKRFRLTANGICHCR